MHSTITAITITAAVTITAATAGIRPYTVPVEHHHRSANLAHIGAGPASSGRRPITAADLKTLSYHAATPALRRQVIAGAKQVYRIRDGKLVPLCSISKYPDTRDKSLVAYCYGPRRDHTPPTGKLEPVGEAKLVAALNGGQSVTLLLTRKIKCQQCKGFGTVRKNHRRETCPLCNGTRNITVKLPVKVNK